MKDGVSRLLVSGCGAFKDGLLEVYRAEMDVLGLDLLLRDRSAPPMGLCKRVLVWVGEADEVDIGVPTELMETKEVADDIALSLTSDQSSTPDLNVIDGKRGSLDACPCN